MNIFLKLLIGLIPLITGSALIAFYVMQSYVPSGALCLGLFLVLVGSFLTAFSRFNDPTT